MPRLRFDAWTNGLSATDPGHMGMLDDRGGYYYEMAMGDVLKANDFSDDQYQHFPKKVKVTDVMSGKARETATRKLDFYRSPKNEYFRRQLMKMTPQGVLRFTHLFYIEVDVSEQEYETVMIQAFVRGAAGAYNMMKEAQVLHPLCTRCLTLLEVLAQEREQQLPPGTALQLVTSFAGFNALAVQNDPLISY